MKKRILYLVAAIGMLFSLAACGSSASPSNEIVNPDFESVEGKKIKITAGDVEVYVTLNGSRAAADLAAMLPLELTLIERNEFAKGMTLPAHLSANEPTTREYQIGDFGYWDAGPDLAIFYDDIYEQTVVPVIPLGKAETGAEEMRATAGTVTLELVPDTEDYNELSLEEER